MCASIIFTLLKYLQKSNPIPQHKLAYKFCHKSDILAYFPLVSLCRGGNLSLDARIFMQVNSWCVFVVFAVCSISSYNYIVRYLCNILYYPPVQIVLQCIIIILLHLAPPAAPMKVVESATSYHLPQLKVQWRQ